MPGWMPVTSEAVASVIGVAGHPSAVAPPLPPGGSDAAALPFALGPVRAPLLPAGPGPVDALPVSCGFKAELLPSALTSSPMPALRCEVVRRAPHAVPTRTTETSTQAIARALMLRSPREESPA